MITSCAKYYLGTKLKELAYYGSAANSCNYCTAQGAISTNASNEVMLATVISAMVLQSTLVVGIPPYISNPFCQRDPERHLEFDDPDNLPGKCFLNSCVYIGFYRAFSHYCDQCSNPQACRQRCFSTPEFESCFKQQRWFIRPSMSHLSDTLFYWAQQRAKMEEDWKNLNEHSEVSNICSVCDVYAKRYYDRFYSDELYSLAYKSLEACSFRRGIICWRAFTVAARLTSRNR